MFFRRRQKTSTTEILDDLAKTIEMVDALVEQERSTGRELNGGPATSHPRPFLEQPLQVATAK